MIGSVSERYERQGPRDDIENANEEDRKNQIGGRYRAPDVKNSRTESKSRS